MQLLFWQVRWVFFLSSFCLSSMFFPPLRVLFNDFLLLTLKYLTAWLKYHVSLIRHHVHPLFLFLSDSLVPLAPVNDNIRTDQRWRWFGDHGIILPAHSLAHFGIAALNHYVCWLRHLRLLAAVSTLDNLEFGMLLRLWFLQHLLFGLLIVCPLELSDGSV